MLRFLGSGGRCEVDIAVHNVHRAQRFSLHGQRILAKQSTDPAVLVQALEDKQQGVEPLMAQIDALDSQMSALETMLERLDAATSRLNDKIVAANTAP